MGFLEDLGRGLAASVTGGLSEALIAGKDAADKVSEEFDRVSDLLGDLEGDAEKIGGNLAIASDKMIYICDQINQTIYDVDDGWIKDRETGQPGEITKLIGSVNDLFEISRLTQRNLSELWPSEEKYLQELYQARSDTQESVDKVQQQLSDALTSLNNMAKNMTDVHEIQGLVDRLVSNPTIENVIIFKMWCYLPSARYTDKLMGSLDTILIILKDLNNLKLQVTKYDFAIVHILYNDPGPVLTISHNINEITEHFFLVEQPKIDDILDSVDKTIDETGEVMEQIKTLFVIKTKKAVLRQLTDVEKKQIAYLKMHMDVLQSSMIKEFDFGSSVGNYIMSLKPQIASSVVSTGEKK